MCSECHCGFHKPCVPKSYQQHIPEEEGDSYLCHNCYHVTEYTDDENNEVNDVESDSDEEFLNTIKDRQEELGLKLFKFN